MKTEILEIINKKQQIGYYQNIIQELDHDCYLAVHSILPRIDDMYGKYLDALYFLRKELKIEHYDRDELTKKYLFDFSAYAQISHTSLTDYEFTIKDNYVIVGLCKLEYVEDETEPKQIYKYIAVPFYPEDDEKFVEQFVARRKKYYLAAKAIDDKNKKNDNTQYLQERIVSLNKQLDECQKQLLKNNQLLKNT